MGWVRVDDAIFTDEAVMAAGPDGRLLFIAGLCHASRNLTDGRIDKRAVPSIASLVTADPAAAGLLVQLGLWVDEEEGFRAPRYLEYNPSREQVLAQRSAAAERMSRRRSGEVRANTDRSSPSSVPVPKTVSSQSSSQHQVGARPQAVDGRREVPEEVWTCYARLKRQQSPTPIRNIASYDRRTIANAKLEHGETAARWWSAFELTPQELAAGLADGQPGRYWTRSA